MRRKDKEVTDRAWIDNVINSSSYMTVALASLDGKPYAVPMSHVYDGENFYFHCAKEGLKLDLIASNSKAAFNVVSKADYYQNSETALYTMHYESVSGCGTVSVVQDNNEKFKAMELIKEKFILGKFTVAQQAVDSVCIIRLHIEEIYGKISNKEK